MNNNTDNPIMAVGLPALSDSPVPQGAGVSLKGCSACRTGPARPFVILGGGGGLECLCGQFRIYNCTVQQMIDNTSRIPSGTEALSDAAPSQEGLLSFTDQQVDEMAEKLQWGGVFAKLFPPAMPLPFNLPPQAECP